MANYVSLLGTNFPWSTSINTEVVEPRVDVAEADTPQALQTALQAFFDALPAISGTRIPLIVSIEYQSYTIVPPAPPSIKFVAYVRYNLYGLP